MQTRTINGRVYALDALPAMQGFALEPLVAPLAGRVLGVMFRHLGDDEGLSLETINLTSVMARAVVLAPDIAGDIGLAIGTIKPADLVQLTRGLLGGAAVDGIPLFPVQDDKRFNEVFAGRTRDLWLALWFAVQVNYPDFLPAPVASAAPSAAGPSAASSTSPGAGASTAASTPAS